MSISLLDKNIFIPRVLHRNLRQIAEEIGYMHSTEFDENDLSTAILHAFVKVYFQETTKATARLIQNFYDEDTEAQKHAPIEDFLYNKILFRN